MLYDDFFRALTSLSHPHQWQRDLAANEVCTDRLIRAPTGFGKTLGVLGAWLYHRVYRQDARWPRRLVWCLPMRVLVEQTEAEAKNAFKKLEPLWHGRLGQENKIGVHSLMGGADAGEWHLYPAQCAVLIGTQDMLLSRAMNRGYACPRARWPMEFGLLSQDCLWVMDEVQLMDVGLATSAQLQAFRGDDTAEGKSLRPCQTWWMSATLQKDWLTKSPDTHEMVTNLPATLCVPKEQRCGYLWEDVSKPCHLTSEAHDDKEIAQLVARKHVEAGCGDSGPTLIVVNTVERAVAVFNLLRTDKTILDQLQGNRNIKLVHSRFRPEERKTWREGFLNRQACRPGTNRIIVATQVIEAGVDISAGLLITELAPWPSLVQRFGRCARWGGQAPVIVVDMQHKDDRASGPYDMYALGAARAALAELEDVSPLCLESFEESLAGSELQRLYPYDPKHLLLRHEIDELFDTTPDLTGGDIDISRFIRSGEERDLQVFWEDVPTKTRPLSGLRPQRAALCAVPFLKARDWLCDKKAPRLKGKMRAWIWNWLDGEWKVAERRDLYPGQTVLVDAECGGYDKERGWDPHYDDKVARVSSSGAVPKITKACWKLDKFGDCIVSGKEVRAYRFDELADSAQDDESLSITNAWQTIATHGRETGRLARELAMSLAPTYADLFDLAGRWHDAGKAHPAFQTCIRLNGQRPERPDLAKAPDAAWPCSTKKLYMISESDCRGGFRHELASTLALFAVLRRHQPDHPALLGPWRELLDKAGMPAQIAPTSINPPTLLEQEILALDAPSFDLLSYLICAHHGKVRMAWHSSPADQDAASARLRIRGIEDRDTLPPLMLSAAVQGYHTLPETELDLAPCAAGLSPRTGAGWTDRVLGLLVRHGPFTLAWLEALLRAADQRASRNKKIVDLLLEADNAEYELERSDRALETSPGGGEAATPMEEHSTQRSGEHGIRAGAGGSDDAGSGTRKPAHATRYVETKLGRLSYTDLAPHLALAVQRLERRIMVGEFDDHPLDDQLIQTLHHHICAELTPQLTDWRRHNVQVGLHTPPEFYRVPVLMREYARDLQARLAALTARAEERLIETLTFVEARLLFIHPFADFNGRVTRVFLRLLLRRLDLPMVSVVPTAEDTRSYLEALRAADKADLQPLMAIWRERFEKEGSG